METVMANVIDTHCLSVYTKLQVCLDAAWLSNQRDHMEQHNQREAMASGGDHVPHEGMHMIDYEYVRYQQKQQQLQRNVLQVSFCVYMCPVHVDDDHDYAYLVLK